MRYYFGGVGAILLLLGCWLAISRISILVSGVRAMGRVERYVVTHDEMDGSDYYTPVVSFEDNDGQAYHFTSTSGVLTFWSKRPSVGMKVAIIYSLKNPARAIRAGFIDIWGGALALAVLGIVGLVISCCGK